MEEINKNKLEDVNKVFNVDETVMEYEGYQSGLNGYEMIMMNNNVLTYQILDSTSIIRVR